MCKCSATVLVREVTVALPVHLNHKAQAQEYNTVARVMTIAADTSAKQEMPLNPVVYVKAGAEEASN